MSLLRMLAFRPRGGDAAEAGETHCTGALPTSSPAPRAAPASAAPSAAAPSAAAQQAARPAAAVAAPPAAPAQASAVAAPAAQPAATPPPVATATLATADDWIALVPALGLKGPALQLGSHAQFHGYADGVLRLHLPEEDAHLRSEASVRKLVDALAPLLGSTSLQLRFEAAAQAGADTLQQRQVRERDQRQVAAEAAFRADPVVASLLGQGAAIVPDSIRPLPEN
jgi:DNA polymerase-3 subunit gamma/tau